MRFGKARICMNATTGGEGGGGGGGAAPAAAPQGIVSAAPPAAAVSATATPTVTVPAPAPAAAAAPTPADPAWLPERLQRAQQAALREAGFATLDEAKAAKAALDATKSEAERTADRIRQLEPAAARAEAQAATIARYAEAELRKLSEPQRAAVIAIAGDDKARALDVIEQLRPTWAGEPAQSAQASAALPAALPATPAAASAPGRTAPPAAGTSSEVNPRAHWQSLRASNPFAAAAYLSANYAAIMGASSPGQGAGG